MTRNVRIGVLVSLASVSLGLGCGKKDSGPGSGTVQGAAVSANDLGMLPADSDIILGINVAQSMNSTLFKKYVEPKMLQGDTKQEIENFKTKCGFDPMTTLKSITVGMKIGADGKPDGVVVAHGFEKSKIAPCLEKYKAEMEKEGTTFTTEGDVIIIKGGGDSPAAIAWANDTTMVAVTGVNATAAGAKAAAEGKGALASSAKFKELYGKLKPTDSVWGIVKGNAPFLAAARSFVNPNYVFGSLNVTSGLTANLGMELENAEKAKGMAEMAQGQIGQAKQMFDKIDVAADGAVVKVDLALSEQKLEALMQQMGPFLGGM